MTVSAEPTIGQVHTLPEPLSSPASAAPVRGSRRGGGYGLCAVVLVLASLCAGAADAAPDTGGSAASDTDYRLGNGLQLPGTDFMLGGYASASYQNLDDEPSRTALDHLSLFVWWDNQQRLKFFSELDYENVVTSRSAIREDEDRYLALERFYVDYAATDIATVRIGKFLTPIGRWNQVHAAPLVWTTSRPLITTNTFPTNVTGAMVTGTVPGVAHGLEYSLYGSGGSEIRANPDIDPFYEALGVHLAVPLAAGQVGFSYASFEQKSVRYERKQLLGLDFSWSWHRYEFSAEGVYRFSDNGRPWDERGAFAQLAVPLHGQLFAVGRYEVYRQAQESGATQLWVGGLNYRPDPAVVLKAEWIGGHHDVVGAPEGFLSSISVLF